MSRFLHHRLRTVDSLDGTWDFVLLGNVDPDSVDIAALRFEDRMAVPGSFDATPGTRANAVWQPTGRGQS
jgi:beta-glucuronidase